MQQNPPPRAGPRRRHDDTPDTGDLFLRIAATAPGAEREALRQQVILAWTPVATRLARRYRGRGESLEDLQQVAVIGLIKAIDRFDPARGSAFLSFAVPTIDGEIKRHFRDHLWSLHVPRRVQELRNRLRAACLDLIGGAAGPSGPGGGSVISATTAEIAARTGMTEAEIRLATGALDSFTTLSLEAVMTGQERAALLDLLGDRDPALDRVVDREALRPRLRALPERERAILYMRFFEDMTQSQIAERLGISQMHVSRLLNSTFSRLRTAVAADPDGV